ncbi:MAG: hypothetical protein NTX64_14825, partial [Elusimicrobia bacterium]|nr:hypothetical protein [Elusimicrobiota bacterium]
DVADPALEAFVKKLSFEGADQEQALLRALAARVLQSPALRELAARFAAGEGAVTTRFADFPGTYIYDHKDGRLAFAGAQAAHVLRAADGARIELNTACLKIDPDYALDECGEHLAHEALGHTLGWLDAGPAGVREAYLYYDDEYWSRLVSWTYDAELDGRVIDPEPWCALGDPQPYMLRLKKVYPASAASLSQSELLDPAAALRAHLAGAACAECRGWIAPILAEFEGEGGAAFAGKLRAAAGSPLFPALDVRAEELRRRLLARPELFFQLDGCSDYL